MHLPVLHMGLIPSRDKSATSIWGCLPIPWPGELTYGRCIELD
jgi:hypothetical protein